MNTDVELPFPSISFQNMKVWIVNNEEFCDAKSNTGYVCTRMAGHTGRHAASIPMLWIEVW